MKDFTFYFHPHNTYFRIDKFLVKYCDLTKVAQSSIDSVAISDHAPVTMRIHLTHMKPSQFQWRINDSLLLQTDVREAVAQEPQHYFSVNTDGGTDAGTIWESHKAYIRGY